MAETFLTPVIRKLVDILCEKAKSLKGVHREIKSLKCELEIIQPFLRDAEAKTERGELSEASRVWLRHLREEADHIEDVFDEYIRFLSQNRLLWALKPRLDIVSEIGDIKKSLCEIKERGQSYGLRPSEQSCASSGGGSSSSGASSGGNIDTRRLDSLFVDEDELVGIGFLSEELKGRLVGGPPARLVISLVGKAGVGKTTLAKKVYDDATREGCFDCCVWINLSQSNTVDGILKIMKNQLCPTTTTKQFGGETGGVRDELINLMRNFLQRKRYVVVFDNVWQTDLWDVAKLALPSNDKGSRIIITTQNNKIAYSFKTASWDVVKELNTLSPDLAWKLFCKKTFPFEFENRCPQELEKLARQILRKCEGLPIAIVAIAGLLSSKEKVESEWRKVLKDLNFEFDENPKLTCVPKALSYSLYDLPYRLRPCFLYFGIFPENYSVTEKMLFRLWIAEGFIQPKGDKTFEKVAEGCLNELIQRNLVSFEVHDGYERRCRVHDLVREIILARVDELGLCQTLSESKLVHSGKSRRLSVNRATKNIFKIVRDSSNIRSFFLFSANELTKPFVVSLLKNYRLLNVLDFGDSPLDDLPKQVGNLFHLKYLNLRGTSVKLLPNSIGKLQNLQVLDVSDTLVQELPIEINKLRNLRHLLASQNNAETELSMDSFQTVQIHEGFGILEELQTLDGVEVHPSKVGFVKDLEKLANLRHLNLGKVTEAIWKPLGAAIEKMIHLERLDLASNNEDEILDLECISNPPLFLCFLSLKGRLKKLPGWISKLQNLQGLELFFSRLSGEPLEDIANLSNLSFLLLYMSYDGEELHFKEGGFRKLKQLNLRQLEGLKAVKIDKRALPALEELDIGPSPLMTEMPSNVQYLKNLRSLEFTDMPKDFVLGLQGFRGSDYWKIDHVPSITFCYKCRGMIYKKYRIGSSILLKYLKVDNLNRNSVHQSSESLSHRFSQNLWLPSNTSSSLGDSNSTTNLATTPLEGSSGENKQMQVLRGQKIDKEENRFNAKVSKSDLLKSEHQKDEAHQKGNESLSEQITLGLVRLEGKMDILSATLETSMHPFNVRVQSQLFERETFSESGQGGVASKNAEVEELKARVDTLTAMYEQLQREFYVQKHGSISDELIAASNIVGETEEKPIRVRKEKTLERAHQISNFLPEKQLEEEAKEGQERKAKEENTTLPEIDISSLPAMLRPVVAYAEKYMDRESTLELVMPEDIFGRKHKNWIVKQDILEFAAKAEISAICISVYIMKLYLRCHEKQILDKFAFVCPSQHAFVHSKTQDEQIERANMLYEALSRARKGQQFLFPYNGGRHWMLVVINPWADEAYWIDPLRGCVRQNIKQVVQRALNIFKSRKDGTFHPPKGNTKWILLKSAPMQPGSVECGFYVMRYMRDIIYKEWNPIPNHFGGITQYNDQDMSDLRNEWGQLVQTLIHW